MLLIGSGDSGWYAWRLFGFGLLALLALGTAVLAYRTPRFWLASLLVAAVLLLLAFSDLRSVGSTSI